MSGNRVRFDYRYGSPLYCPLPRTLLDLRLLSLLFTDEARPEVTTKQDSLLFTSRPGIPFVTRKERLLSGPPPPILDLVNTLNVGGVYDYLDRGLSRVRVEHVLVRQISEGE